MTISFPCLPGLLLVFLVAAVAPASAAVHLVAPPAAAQDAAQDAGADGSPGHPWPSVAAALASGQVRGGDEIRLLAGAHGDVTVSRAVFDAPVRIGAVDGAMVHLTGLKIERSRNLVFEGFRIWPLGRGYGALVQTDTRSERIVLRDLDIRSRVDADTYPHWTKEDWLAARRGGVLVEGPDNAVLSSRFTGLSFAIGATGLRARIDGNVVRGFSGDAARVLGDGSVFRANRIEDCVQIDENHADGFQSWSRGPKGESGRGTVRGLHLEHNAIREWAHPVVSPLRCSLQGIGMFDGMFEDIVIRNNLVEVSAPHGIAVAGGRRVEIVHNTVINNRRPHPKFPWISINPHKNGTPALDGLIANNIAATLDYPRAARFRITASGNLLGVAPVRIFVDPARGDFRPRRGGPADGRADPAHVPPTDLFGHPRRQRPDIGAIAVP